MRAESFERRVYLAACVGWVLLTGLRFLLLCSSKLIILCFEVEDHADAGEVESGGEEVADPS